MIDHTLRRQDLTALSSALAVSLVTLAAAPAFAAAEYNVPATHTTHGQAVQAAPFHPVAPGVPIAPAKGQTPCDYYGSNGSGTNGSGTNGSGNCAAPTPSPSAELSFVRTENYAVQQPTYSAPVQQVVVQQPIVHQPVVHQPIVQHKLVQKPIVRIIQKPVVRVVEKKTRPFADLWTFVGLGMNYRTVTIPGDKGDTKFNFISSDVRAGVIYHKYVGIEGRLGLAFGGSDNKEYHCGYGYTCPLTVKAPMHAAIYARGQIPIGPGHRIVPYGLIGAAYKRYETALTTPHGTLNEKFARWDLSYGAGVEFKVNKELSIGAEYVNHGHDDQAFGINARYTF